MDDQNQTFRLEPKRWSAFCRRLQRIDREIILSKSTFKILAIGWTGAILCATLSPSDGVPLFDIPIPHFDKLVHFGLFFVYAIFMGLTQKIMPGIRLAIIAGISLAVFTEWMQSYVPGRQPDIYDGFADIFGTALALLAIYMYGPRRTNS